MKTRRTIDLIPNIDNDEVLSAYIDSTTIPTSDTNDSSSMYISTEYNRSQHSFTLYITSPSSDAILLTITSNESLITTTNIKRVYQSTVSNPLIRIDNYFGLYL